VRPFFDPLSKIRCEPDLGRVKLFGGDSKSCGDLSFELSAWNAARRLNIGDIGRGHSYLGAKFFEGPTASESPTLYYFRKLFHTCIMTSYAYLVKQSMNWILNGY
jgi:hypothetical protein